jgi:DHA3 family macrolide efflux protein-like MFS transporter
MVIVPYQAILQSTVPPRLQGRVFALNSSLLNIVTPLGLAVAGPLADAIGLRPIFYVAGLVGLAVAGVWFAVPAWRDCEDGPPEGVLAAVVEREMA